MPSIPAKPASHRYLKDAGGNIAVMFALSLLVVAGAAGSAIDYVRYSQTQTAYNAAADSAAIAAVAAALKASSEGKTGI